MVFVSWVMWKGLVEVRGCKGLGDRERIEDGELGDWWRLGNWERLGVWEGLWLGDRYGLKDWVQVE